MGYKIIKDNIHTSEDEKQYSLVGREYGDYQGGKHRIRLLDADENVYLYAYSDIDYVKGDCYEDEAFAPVDRFMNSYGVTDLQYKNENGEYETL